MAVTEILVAAATGRALAGYIENDVLVRLEFGAEATDRRLGEIVLGRVQRADAGLDAAFVDIGGRSGLLESRKLPAKHRVPGEGGSILVQINREAEAEKAAKLTAAVALPGTMLIFCPARSGIRVSRRLLDEGEHARLLTLGEALPAARGGWFLRRGATGADAAAIDAEARDLLATWDKIEDLAKHAKAPARLWRPPDPVLTAIAEEAGPALMRIVADDPGILAAIRNHLPSSEAELRLVAGAEAAAAVKRIEAGIDAILAPDVALSGGGAVRMAETPALVAIDVDAGSHRAGAGEETALAVNLEACAAIVREIRRRELSGHLVVDFVAMRRRESRNRLVAELRSAFAGDRIETHVAGYTALGKVELTRRRVRPSVRDRLCARCPACVGTGRVLAPEAAARHALRAAVHDLTGCGSGAAALVAAPAVVAALRGVAAEALGTVEARLGRKLSLREDPGAAADSVRIEIGAKDLGRTT